MATNPSGPKRLRTVIATLLYEEIFKMQDSSTKISGFVVAWNLNGLKVRYQEVVDALDVAGLDKDKAKELAPQHAWTRACKKLEKDRVIKETMKDGDLVYYQFTQEQVSGEEVNYIKEDTICLNKKEGKVYTRGSADLQNLAQSLLNECIVMRTGADLGNIVQKIFEGTADLIPVRDQGGCYIVPGDKSAFLEKVNTFCLAIGGKKLRRFPVFADDESGKESIKECMNVWIDSLIDDHARAIEKFSEDTKESTVKRRVQKVMETKLKVEAYASHLQDRSAGLLAKLGELQEILVQKVKDMGEKDGEDGNEENAAEETLAPINFEAFKADMQQYLQAAARAE
jgi:hypothetical protein